MVRGFGEDTAVTPEKFCRVEDQEVWGQPQELGREIAARLKAQLAILNARRPCRDYPA